MDGVSETGVRYRNFWLETGLTNHAGQELEKALVDY
jgi:hypothetical protein